MNKFLINYSNENIEEYKRLQFIAFDNMKAWQKISNEWHQKYMQSQDEKHELKYLKAIENYSYAKFEFDRLEKEILKERLEHASNRAIEFEMNNNDLIDRIRKMNIERYQAQNKA